MAAGRIKGITIEIGGNTTKLVSALANVDKQIKNTQNNLKDVNKLLKMDPGNTELLQQKQKLLGDAVAQTSDRLNQLKDAQSQVAKGSEEWDALQREIIETEQNLDSLKKDVSDFGSVVAQKIKVVGEKFQEVGGKIEDVGQKVSKISGVAAGALGGLAKLGYDAVTAADDLNTLSKQTGVSTDELQKWSYASDLVDVSTETITSSMKKMKKNMSSNEKAFEALGVKTRYNSGQLKDSTEVFYDVIEALSRVQNETERDVLAMNIFGKSADDLAGVIDDGGAALKAYGEEAENLGLIIDGDTLDSLNEANDTIDKMKATMGASLAQAGATIAQTFAPALEKVSDVIGQVAEKIRSLTPEQTEMITKILAVVAAVGPLLIVVGKVVSAIGMVMQVVSLLGGPITLIIAAIGALVAAFVYFYNTNEDFRNKVNEVFTAVKDTILNFIENAKAWIQQFIEWVGPIINSILEWLSPVIEGAKEQFVAIFDALVALAQGVIAQVQMIKDFILAFYNDHKAQIDTFLSIIQTKIQAALEIIRTIFVTATNVITSLLKAFTAIMRGDWDGAMTHIKNAAQSLKNGLVNIFKTMWEAIKSIFKTMVEGMKTWGKDMIDGFINGIKERIGKVKDTMKDVADAIREFIHFSEPDVGPLSDFSTYAPDMMKLFAQGIRDNAYLITDAVGSSFDLRPYFNSMTSGINKMTNVASSSMQAQAQQGPVVVQVSLEGDANRLFRVLSEEARRDWQITGTSKLMGY